MKQDKFIILTAGRTGSSYIRLWLNNHPHIRAHSEIFSRFYGSKDGFNYYNKALTKKIILYYAFKNRLTNQIVKRFLSQKNIDQYLNDLYLDSSFSGPWTQIENWDKYHKKQEDLIRTVGFKISYDQLRDFNYLTKYIQETNLKVIHLLRQNILEQLVSLLAAKKRKIFHSNTELKQISILLDPQKTINMLDKIKKEQNKYRTMYSTSNPYIEITYENFFNSYEETSKKIFRFLEVIDMDIEKPNLKKLNMDPLKKIIHNYHDIANVLKNRDYEVFLY